MLSGEATNTNFIVFGLFRSGLEHTLEASTPNYYTTYAKQRFECYRLFKD